MGATPEDVRRLIILKWLLNNAAKARDLTYIETQMLGLIEGWMK